MRLDDTIVAVASPGGRAPRAIIRLTGPHTTDVIRRLDACAPVTSGVHVITVPLSGEPLVALAIMWSGPRSFTGQDSCELLIPGNPHLVERVLAAIFESARDVGVRAADPGEFSARAYLTGRLTLDQAEGIAATIGAANEAELRYALDLRSGVVGARYRQWRDELATLAALIEAGIDFTDSDDVVAIAPDELARRLRAVDGEIASFTGAATGAAAPRELASVVLVGRPNAGKSTLFNALLKRNRAVASPIAGTTRDVLVETLDLSKDLAGGPIVELVDLAGLDDDAATGVPAQARDAAIAAIAQATAIIHCDPDPAALASLPAGIDRADRPVLLVQTKSDLTFDSVCDSALAKQGRSRDDVIHACAIDGRGIASLRRAIGETALRTGGAGVASMVPRHRAELGELREAIRGAIGSASELSTEPALVAECVRRACHHAAALGGRIETEEVLGRVFATFCIGK